MLNEASVSRRTLLVVAAGSAAIAACGPLTVTGDGGVDAGTDAPGDPDATPVDAGDDAAPDASATCSGVAGTLVGPVSQFAVGTLVAPRTGGAIIVGQDAGGLYAFSSICTHQGCTALVSGSGVRCPCHRATFDANGGSPTPPATRPLAHYALAVCDGNVYVDVRQTVAATIRTPPA